jgi:hypothetical protein
MIPKAGFRVLGHICEIVYTVTERENKLEYKTYD